MFESIMASPMEMTFIFTDQQSSDDIGSATSREYADAARRRNSIFLSVILDCEFEENIRRLQAVDRGEGTKRKLTDTGIFRSIRETEDIHHFGGNMEFTLNNSKMSAAQAAKVIYNLVQAHSN
jgi:hypothetical protein